MKLRNKKTGEILGSLGSFIIQNPNHINCEAITKYDSLAELNEEWEDYEEPKEYWFLSTGGEPHRFEGEDEIFTPNRKSIGNYFLSREEAERVVEKLKAWKRLKDAGVSFKPTTIGHKWYLEPHASPENRTFKESQELFKDVMLFFGGEDGEE